MAVIDFGTTCFGYMFCTRDNNSKICCPIWIVPGYKTYERPPRYKPTKSRTINLANYKYYIFKTISQKSNLQPIDKQRLINATVSQ